MTVVVDCNVVVSAAWNGGVCLAIVRRCVERDLIVLSPAILAEYRRVETYPKLAHIRPRLAALIDTLAARAMLVADADAPVTLPDAHDEAYLAAATVAGADCIVTGNLRHFPERRYGSIRVLSVRELATELGVALG